MDLAQFNTSLSMNGSLYDNTTSILNETSTIASKTQQSDMRSTLNQNIQVVTLTLLPALYIVGMLGNVLTLVVLGSHEITSMASRYILILLACCDMTMLSSHLFNKQGFSQVVGVDVRAFSIIGCKIFFHIYRTTKMMSSWLVVMLCLERYTAVVFPLKFKTIITRRRVFILILCTFLFLVTFNAAWSFSTEVVKSKGKSQCKQLVETETNGVLYRAFLIAGEAIFSWIPVCLMMTFTPAIIYKLVRQIKRKKRMSNSSSGGSGTARISVMLVAVVIAYVIFILPVTLFHINKSFYNLGVKSNTVGFVIFREVVQFLEMVNYSTNFILYALSSTPFRSKLSELMCGCRRSQSRDDSSNRRSSKGTELTNTNQD